MSNATLSSPSFPRFEDLVAPSDDGSYRGWEVTPAAWPELPYRIILPAGWNREDDASTKPRAPGEITRIGLFADRLAPDAAIVQISCWKLPAEIATWDWLHFQAGAINAEVISARLLEDGAGEATDAIAWYGPEDNRYAARVVCRADHGFIFCIMAMAPADRYEAMKDDLALAAASFRLEQAVAPGQLEHWEEVTVATPDFRVSRPDSWTHKSIPAAMPGKSGIEFYLNDPNGTLLAYARVKAVDPKLTDGAAETLFRLAHEELTEGPVRLQGQWEDDEDPVITARAGLVLARRAQATMNSTEIEVRIAVTERGPLRFCASLISVLQGDDTIVWMRSKRAFAIALATARPA